MAESLKAKLWVFIVNAVLGTRVQVEQEAQEFFSAEEITAFLNDEDIADLRRRRAAANSLEVPNAAGDSETARNHQCVACDEYKESLRQIERMAQRALSSPAPSLQTKELTVQTAGRANEIDRQIRAEKAIEGVLNRMLAEAADGKCFGQAQIARHRAAIMTILSLHHGEIDDQAITDYNDSLKGLGQDKQP